MKTLKVNWGLWVVSAAAVALFRWHQLIGHDYWCYLATGRYIVTQRAFPRVDVFSWTVPGHRWVAHEWLFQLLLFWIYQMTGWNGMTVYQICWILTALFFVQRRLRDAKVPTFWQWISVAVVFWGSRARWGLRADLPSIALLSLLALTFSEEDPQKKHPVLFWSWPLLFCLWANMHGGFILGLVVATLWALAQWWPKRTADKGLLLWLGLCLAATFINPYGAQLHLTTLKGLSAFQSSVLLEWRRTPWNPYQWFWGSFAFFWVVLLITGTWRKISLPRLLIHLLLSWAAISHRRNIVFFFIFSFPDAVIFIWTWLRGSALAEKLQRFDQTGIAAAILITGLTIGWMAPKHHWRLTPDFYPLEAYNFLDQANIPEPTYNDFTLGSYWMWRFGSTRPLFIDSRLHAVDGYLELFDRSDSARNGTPAQWNRFLDDFKIESAVLEYSPLSPKRTSNYFDKAQWALVYWDDKTLIFVRRDAKNQRLIAQTEFAWVHPDEPMQEFLRRAHQSAKDLRLARQELERNQALHPNSRRVRELLNALLVSKSFGR